MASWLRSLWKNPKNAVVPRGENEPALIAAEYYGIFDEAGRCVALPETTFDDRHCHVCPVGSVPEASDFLRSIGATPRPSLSQPLRIVVISDTHEFHQHLVLPPGDILIHCGDVLTIDRFNIGAISNYNIKDFFAWFNAQPFPLRIVIGGNHDHQFAKLGKDTIKRLASPSIYLEDELLDVGGLRFFGTPRSTANSRGSGNVAFQKVPELELGLEVWPTALPATALQLQVECDSDPTETSGARIAVAEVPRSSLSSPDTVHFFMTHGSSNCSRVRRAIASLAPSLHLCGHVHEMHGAWALGPTAQECERLTPSNKTGPSAWHRSIVSINGASTRGKPMRERLHAPIVFDFALTDSTAATTVQLLNQLAPAGRVRS